MTHHHQQSALVARSPALATLVGATSPRHSAPALQTDSSAPWRCGCTTTLPARSARSRCSCSGARASWAFCSRRQMAAASATCFRMRWPALTSARTTSWAGCAHAACRCRGAAKRPRAVIAPRMRCCAAAASCGLSTRTPQRTQSHDDQVTSFLTQMSGSGLIHVRSQTLGRALARGSLLALPKPLLTRGLRSRSCCAWSSSAATTRPCTGWAPGRAAPRLPRQRLSARSCPRRPRPPPGASPLRPQCLA